MTGDDRLDQILARRSDAAERARQELEARRQKAQEKAAERARLIELWQQRFSELEAAVYALNAKIEPAGMQLTIQSSLSPENHSKTLATAAVEHRPHTQHVKPRYSLRFSMNQEGQLNVVISNDEGQKPRHDQFPGDVSLADKWDGLLLDFLDASVVSGS